MKIRPAKVCTLKDLEIQLLGIQTELSGLKEKDRMLEEKLKGLGNSVTKNNCQQ